MPQMGSKRTLGEPNRMAALPPKAVIRRLKVVRTGGTRRNASLGKRQALNYPRRKIRRKILRRHYLSHHRSGEPICAHCRRFKQRNREEPDMRTAAKVAVGRGLDAIDAIIGSVQRRFPNFSFALSGEADGHGNVVRFSWALGPKQGAAVVKGTDFVERDFDKICAVTGFLDLVPATA